MSFNTNKCILNLAKAENILNKEQTKLGIKQWLLRTEGTKGMASNTTFKCSVHKNILLMTSEIV